MSFPKGGKYHSNRIKRGNAVYPLINAGIRKAGQIEKVTCALIPAVAAAKTRVAKYTATKLPEKLIQPAFLPAGGKQNDIPKSNIRLCGQVIDVPVNFLGFPQMSFHAFH